jgi:uncharacterized membrane protein
MDLARFFRHLATPTAAVRLRFPPRTLAAIEREIAASERTHDGQIRFAVEAALAPLAVLAGQTARERALEVFSRLRVWDTERNNGVLVYLLLADRDVEIVADRGIHAAAGGGAWEAVCREMEGRFREGAFEAGAVGGIRAVGALLARSFPRSGPARDELPDRPEIIE